MKTRCPQCRVVVDAPDDWIEQGGYRCSNCGRTNRPPKPKAEDIPPPTSESAPRRPASAERSPETRGSPLARVLGALCLLAAFLIACFAPASGDAQLVAIVIVLAMAARIFQASDHVRR